MQKPEYCRPCALYHKGNGFSRPDGRGTIGVCFIGEGLGREEYLDGLPFRPRAEAGSCLTMAIKKLGYSREQFLFWNLIACQPPNNQLAGAWYETTSISHCRKHFDDVMENWKPPTTNRVLVACGNLAMRELTGMSGDAGSNESIKYTRGYVFKSKYGYVIPSYHPSFIRRGNMQQLDSLIHDIQRAVDLAMGDYDAHIYDEHFRKPDYNTHASLTDMVSFYNRAKENSRLVVYMDIETRTFSGAVSEDEWGDFQEDLARDDIELMQFSLEPGKALAIPFIDVYFELVRDIMLLPNQKAGHNWYGFDGPRLEAAGFRCAGVVHDTMNMFKMWHPRLDRHLQGAASHVGFPFPWKHMFSSRKSWYGCADVDSGQYLITKLPKMMHGIKAGNGVSVWDCYRDHLLRIRPILERAEKVGIPIDEEKRQALETKLRGIRDGLVIEAQKVVPEEIRNIHPRRKIKGANGEIIEGEFSYGFKAVEPKPVKDAKRIYRELVAKLKAKAERGEFRGTGKRVKSFKVWVKENFGLEIRELTEWEPKGREDGGNKGSGEYVKVKRWVKVKDFLPTSPDQVKAYMVWKKGQIEKQIRKMESERGKKR